MSEEEDQNLWWYPCILESWSWHKNLELFFGDQKSGRKIGAVYIASFISAESGKENIINFPTVAPANPTQLFRSNLIDWEKELSEKKK